MKDGLLKRTQRRVDESIADMKKHPRNALIDAARGALMGMTTDVLGYPVDVATMAMRPFGYDVAQPVGGSDWLAQRLTSPTGSPAETVGRVAGGMLTPDPMDYARAAGLLPKAAGPVQELTTYHGSPHRINNVDEAHPMGRFDLSKVGTGEGAQAYGHGVYLAERPGVAKSYQKKLAGGIDGLLVDPKTAREELLKRVEKASRKIAYDDPNRGGLSIAAAHVDRLLQDAAEGKFPKQSSKWQGMLPSAFSELKKFGIKTGDLFTESKGHFYTVDLPDEHIAKMLDWDAPLSEQPAILEQMKKAGLTDGEMFFTQEGAVPVADLTGGAAYEHLKLQAFHDEATPWAQQYQNGAQAASQHLRSLGIPGIKYYDGVSRKAGEGTRNFVIFDPDIAKILKRE